MKKHSFLILFFLPLVGYAKFHELNYEKEEWYLSIGGKVEKELISRIEGPINDFFNEPIYNILEGLIRDSFGDIFSESLAGMISVGPFLKIDSLIGSMGRSEAQIMTDIILRAIDQAKEEIIASVEQQFKDETRARLNALISNYEIYNARPDSDRQFLFFQLGELISEATYIRERISIKPASYAEDIHPYLTVSSLQVMMQKEYTRWVSLNNNPAISEVEIEQEIMAVMAVMVGQINNFFIQRDIGTLSYWEDSFSLEFPNDLGKYVGAIDETEIDVSKYKVRGSQRYSYSMGDEDIEFSVYLLKDECHYDHFDSGSYTMVRHFEVYDAVGEYVKKIYKDGGGYYISPDDSVCDPSVTATNAEISGGVFQSIYQRSQFVPDVRDRHKNDVEAFNAYLVDGYLPVKRALDEWWDLTGSAARPLSEVDLYIETDIEPRHDLSVSFVSSDDIAGLGKLAVYRVDNLGGGVASLVSLQVTMLTPGFSMTGLGATDENGVSYPSFHCVGNQCMTASMQPGGAMEMAVLLHNGAVGSELEVMVEASSAGPEITARNNRIDQTIVF